MIDWRQNWLDFFPVCVFTNSVTQLAAIRLFSSVCFKKQEEEEKDLLYDQSLIGRCQRTQTKNLLVSNWFDFFPVCVFTNKKRSTKVNGHKLRICQRSTETNSERELYCCIKQLTNICIPRRRVQNHQYYSLPFILCVSRMLKLIFIYYPQ